MLVRIAFSAYLLLSSFLIIFSPANQTAPGALFRLGAEQFLDPEVEHLGPIFSSELALGRTSVVTLNIPEQLLPMEDDIAQKLLHAHQELEHMLGPVEVKSLSVELVPDYEFYEVRKAPRWVNAMYSNNVISIPVNSDTLPTELFASIQHEYAHAAIRAVSSGACPVWLDEGIAQVFEAHHHPEIASQLGATLKNEAPIKLVHLEKSFTQLATELLPIAYAQSYYAAKALLERHSTTQMRQYFSLLRQGFSHPHAFNAAFGVSAENLDSELMRQHFATT